VPPRLPHRGDPRRAWSKLGEQFEAFAHEIGRKQRKASDIAAWPRKAGGSNFLERYMGWRLPWTAGGRADKTRARADTS
jgi:hypothetical protein